MVSIQDDSADWHDAPVLYVCGNRAIEFSSEQQAKLKRYVEDGGLILFNDDCGMNQAFVDSVERLGRQLFDRDFRPLPGDSAIYTNEEFRRAQWRHVPTVLGLSNGVREMMLLIPDADLSAAWQVNSPLIRPEPFQLGTDIFLYAVDKQNLRNKGDSYLVKADPSINTSRQIKVVRLDYGAGWNPEPGGWRRLSAVMHNRDAVDLPVTDVKLGDGALASGGFQVAHLTGTSAFTLTAAQRGDRTVCPSRRHIDCRCGGRVTEGARQPRAGGVLRIAHAFSHGAAAKNMMSPSATASFCARAAFSASEKNFMIGDFHSPPSTLTKARPFVLSDFATSSRFFSSPCVRSASPRALSALTAPPGAAAAA